MEFKELEELNKALHDAGHEIYHGNMCTSELETFLISLKHGWCLRHRKTDGCECCPAMDRSTKACAMVTILQNMDFRHLI